MTSRGSSIRCFQRPSLSLASDFVGPRMSGVDSIKLLLAAALVFMSCAARGDPLAAIRAAQSSQPQAPTLPREVFLAQASLREVRLAPDGRQVAFVREVNGQRSL